jgi:hypothetical protein
MPSLEGTLFMANPSLRTRQIHLDFHTSPDIPEIAADFDADQFADTLAEAAVNSVTCFARCHHGYLYYPSKRNPERIHPHLQQPDLLNQQIAACHERDIRVPIYITVQWDKFTAQEHPDWLWTDQQGKPLGTEPFEPGFYRFLGVNSPYFDWLTEHVRDVFECVDVVDGIFFDIVQPRPDCSKWTQRQMTEAGLDPADPVARAEFGVEVIARFKREMTEFVRRFSRDCTIFYNAGHIGPRHRRSLDAYSHLELESLPSGGWGYLHFPLTMRYARNLGIPCLGMTGKFHTSWGDFHSFKNTAALEYECFMMQAMGASCSVGDQLHPRGQICKATYDLVGSVYRQVEAVEPWSDNARPISQIAVLTPEAFVSASDHQRLPAPMMGAVRMLQELGRPFEIVDDQSDFAGFKLLILPDEIPVSGQLAAKIKAFTDAGGKLLASHEAGLGPDRRQFALDQLGLSYVGPAPFSPDFLLPGDSFGQSLASSAHVMYQRGSQVEPADAARVLCQVQRPYFNRTWKHFCSHQHTPGSGEVVYPGVVETDQSIYFAHPIFWQYHESAPRWCKLLLAEALTRLIGPGLIRHDGPSSLLVALNEQAEHNRWVIHLLHYIAQRRSEKLDIIEEPNPTGPVRLSLASGRAAASVRRVPEGVAVAFEQRDDELSIDLDDICGRLVLEIAWK